MSNNNPPTREFGQENPHKNRNPVGWDVSSPIIWYKNDEWTQSLVALIHTIRDVNEAGDGDDDTIDLEWELAELRGEKGSPYVDW